MNNVDIVSLVLTICVFGWIPLLALASVIRAFRHTTDINVDSVIVNTQNIEELDEDYINKIVLNNTKISK